eukprot:254773-Pyramimonas_sp.AAC.1
MGVPTDMSSLPLRASPRGRSRHRRGPRRAPERGPKRRPRGPHAAPERRASGLRIPGESLGPKRRRSS